MSDGIAIKVSHVSKDFVLPHLRVNSVKALFTGLAKTKSVKRKEKQHALKDIDFEVKKGEFFGIVGRNGSGKSTLLKILAGIYQPTQGQVKTYGKLVPFIELGVGFNSELTGRENVYLNGAMLGFSRKEVDAMYDAIVSFAELERFMDQKLKNYSSGMQVRLAFSMAIRAKADILLIDEVLAVGDADFQRKCFDYFRKLKRDETTVIFVSHDMSAVREYCDRAIMIENNKVIAEGDADTIATDYTRMFIEEAVDVTASEKESKRWGNRTVLLTELVINPEKLTSKEQELTISATMQADTDIKNPIIGFSIKSPDGKPLLGTNTKLDRIHTGSWEANMPKSISWSLQNIFREGLHEIDIAILDQDGITVYDWIENAGRFRSYDEKTSPYNVSPDVKTVLGELHNAKNK